MATVNLDNFPNSTRVYADHIKKVGVATMDELLKLNLADQFSLESPPRIQQRIVRAHIRHLIECELAEYDDHTETVRWIDG